MDFGFIGCYGVIEWNAIRKVSFSFPFQTSNSIFYFGVEKKIGRINLPCHALGSCSDGA